MNRRKLIAVAAEKNGYAKWEVNKITDSLLESIFDALQQGEQINLKGFGRFELKVRKARATVHPRTKQIIHMPERINITFTVSTKFKVADGVLEKIKAQKEGPCKTE